MYLENKKCSERKKSFSCSEKNRNLCQHQHDEFSAESYAKLRLAYKIQLVLLDTVSVL